MTSREVSTLRCVKRRKFTFYSCFFHTFSVLVFPTFSLIFVAFCCFFLDFVMKLVKARVKNKVFNKKVFDKSVFKGYTSSGSYWNGGGLFS